MEDKILDTSGLACPLPILRLKKAIKLLEEGENIKLLTTDASTAHDMEAFCALTHNTLVASYSENDVWIYIIQKGV